MVTINQQAPPSHVGLLILASPLVLCEDGRVPASFQYQLTLVQPVLDPPWSIGLSLGSGLDLASKVSIKTLRLKSETKGAGSYIWQVWRSPYQS